MKTLIFILLLIPTLILGQNVGIGTTTRPIGSVTFGSGFTQADKEFQKSAEWASVKAKLETDSILMFQTLTGINESPLTFYWKKYLADCKKPYYKDTVVIVDIRKEKAYAKVWEFNTITTDYIIPAGKSNFEIVYLKKWHIPTWDDFWNRYLVEQKIIKRD